ncbi:SGNH/GDSL hydrolase family protein [Ruminococcus flavefaciens]|uniref:SGNH/GDSL hydrolase family protein n=1 Tax=Ruminococcus flavefaciens TaxID=1265 RepID=UPI0004659671|nr:SGNH/GDSL hydrolase family protein [Ruminococcus flavefaciens]
MFRRIAAAVSAAILSVSLVSCSMTEKTAKEVVYSTEVPPKMLFLGDSIAAGYGLEGYTDTDNYHCRSYSNILKDEYAEELRGKCGHTMVNKAVSGATSNDLIEQLRSGELDGDLADCDAIVVSIGGNDLLGIMLDLLGSMGISESGSFDSGNIDFFSAAALLLSIDGDANKALEQFELNIKTIVAELSGRTEGTIYIQTLYDPLEYYTKFKRVTEFSSEKIGRLNEMITENSSCGYKVIDVAADFKGRAGSLTNIAAFDIHPNAQGHELIAKDVDAAFRSTGFTYTTTEYGDRKLSSEGRIAIAGIIAGIALLAVVGLALLIRKKKEK